MQIYRVTIIRPESTDLRRGYRLGRQQQIVKVGAYSADEAVRFALKLCTIQFYGHDCRILVDGVQYDNDES